MKRLLATPLQGGEEENMAAAIEGAHALLCLTSRSALPPAQPQEQQQHDVYRASLHGAVASHAGRRSAEPAAGKASRHVAKAARTSYSTRSYVWRGPHRGALALQKMQQQPGAASGRQQQFDTSAPEGNSSSRRSSNSGAAHSDDEEVHQLQQIPSSSRQRDKEWAALTTWLRMNLHHPRTAKKLVLFVGHQDQTTGGWSFELNPGLTWDDVSIETKLRLQTLHLEAEQAFQHKYPDRPRHEWGSKVQKYKPPGSSSTVNVCLSDMVSSLSHIYFQHEPSHDSTGSKQHQQQATEPMHSAAGPSAGGIAAASSSEQQSGGAYPLPMQQASAADAASLDPGAFLPAFVQAAEPTALLEAVAAAAGTSAAVGTAAHEHPGGNGGVSSLLSLHERAAGMERMEQHQHEPRLALDKMQLLPGAAVGMGADGAESCTESAATPVAAWSQYMAG